MAELMSLSKEEPYLLGTVITFGKYPQNQEGVDQTPIEWLVLDRKEQRALLLSKYGLDVKAYHEQKIEGDDAEDEMPVLRRLFNSILQRLHLKKNSLYGEEVTWEKCSLRNWLNSTFIDRAFTMAEQRKIVLSDVDNSHSSGYEEWKTDGGNDTQDQIFLLSYAEVKKYFGETYETKNMNALTVPTAYAKQAEAYTDSRFTTESGEETGLWWLRSPGCTQDEAAVIEPDGKLFSLEAYDDEACIRPALWIQI